MPTASSMTPMHSVGQDDQNKVQHYFLVMMPVALFMAPLHLSGQDDQNEL